MLNFGRVPLIIQYFTNPRIELPETMQPEGEKTNRAIDLRAVKEIHLKKVGLFQPLGDFTKKRLRFSLFIENTLPSWKK